MAQIKRLGRPSKERNAITRNQATDLLWLGKITTTVAKAKALRSYAEKILTLAINSYEDTVKTQKTVVDEKGNKVVTDVINDGPKKLAARRQIMSKLYTVKEKRLKGETKEAFIARTEKIKKPLIEKIFNVYAPSMQLVLRNLVKVAVTLVSLNLVFAKATLPKWQSSN